MWTLKTGIHVARKLEDALGAKYHVALGGGVLHKGKSFHDLDLVVYPHKTDESYLSEVWRGAESIGLRRVLTGQEMIKKWSAQGNFDRKWVEVYDYNGRRVDLICFLWEEA